MHKNVLQKLKDGNKRFTDGNLKNRSSILPPSDSQDPYAVIITCSDARTEPALIFDMGLGDLFITRVAGNIITPEIAGSVEYAVEYLGTSLIVVLGHTNCGAVTAALKGEHLSDNIMSILYKIRPKLRPNARPNSNDDLSNTIDPDENITVVDPEELDTLIKNNVANSIKELTNYSPMLKKAVAANKIKIIGGIYDLETGMVAFDE